MSARVPDLNDPPIWDSNTIKDDPVKQTNAR